MLIISITISRCCRLPGLLSPFHLSKIMKDQKFAMPDASIILLCVAVIAYLTTLVVTPGVFVSQLDSQDVALSQYQTVETAKTVLFLPPVAKSVWPMCYLKG